MVLAFACASMLAASGSDGGPRVPWYVPRGAALGVFINPPTVNPHVRLAWEGTFLAQPRNELGWVVNLGTAAGLGLQAPMREHYQHVALAGLAYRSNRPLVHWGFQFAAGPVWYRTAYARNALYGFESRVLGYVEGRAQLGLRLAPHFVLALYAGYASPFEFNPRFPGNIFVGGPLLGLCVDWR
jgi:hypothetical protein